MSRFSTERAAKEYLAGEIVREAARVGAPLTEIEQKMLYYSESGWTLPDIGEAAEAFGQETDSRKYERKIARLARSARRHAGKAGASAWSEALERLESGDHYLLVLVRPVRAPRRHAMTWRAAVAVIVALIALAVGRGVIPPLLLGHEPTPDEMGSLTWAAVLVLTVAGFVIRFFAGPVRFDAWVRRVFAWFDRGRRT